MNRQRGNVAAMAAGVCLALVATSAVGLEASTGVIEEIVVTGTKRPQPQQSAPVAVSTITGDFLERRFASDIREAADLAPNVFFENIGGYNAASIGIRGASTGDIILTFDPAVAVVVDGIVHAHVQSQMLEAFDIDQMEIYRGPQGTLFGRNTTGGVVYVSTKRPGDVLQGTASIRAGNYGERRAQLGVDVPISDSLKFRFAGMFEENDGFYSNDKPCGGCAPGTPGRVGAGEDVGGKEVFYGRAKLLWEPTDRYEAFLQFELIDDNSQTPPVVNETPDGHLFDLIGFPGIEDGQDPFSTGISFRDDGLNMRQGHRIDVEGVYLEQTLDVTSYSFTSITGYRHQLSRLPSSFGGEAFASLYDVNRSDERDIYQQELRVSSEYSGPFNFVSGVFYHRNELDHHSMPYFGFLTVAGADPQGNLDPTYQGATQDQEAWALFFDSTYQMTDALTLTVGARQTWEEKEFFRFTNARLSAFGLTGADYDEDDFFLVPADVYATAPTAFVFSGDDDWSKLTFRAGLDYAISDDLMTYFMYSQGFKGGGFNEQCKSVGSCQSFDEEVADSYEVGIKSDLMDGRLRLNAAGFYVVYDDIQRDQVVQFVDGSGNVNQETKTTNAGKMTMWGLELESTFLPLSNLRLTGSVGYLNAKYDEFMTDLDGDSVNDDASFLEPTRAPEWQVGVDVSYLQRVQESAEIAWTVGGSYQSESEFMTLNNPNSQVESRTLLNASATYTSSDDRFSVSLYGKNLTDETYRVSSNAVGAIWTFSQYGAPRRYGVEFAVRF